MINTDVLTDSCNELTLAHLCELVYDDPVDLRGTIIDQFDKMRPFQENGTEAMGLLKGDTAVLVIRGTEVSQRSDILADLKFTFPKKHESGHGHVHRGFVNYSKQIGDQVRQWVRTHKPKRIICCGHSLGAASATLFAADFIHLRMVNEVHLFTVGSPRVGTKDFSEWLSSALVGCEHRYVNSLDGVTRVPPPFFKKRLFRFFNWTFPPYRHVGTAKFFDEKGDLTKAPDRAQKLLSAISATRKNKLAIGADHSSSDYRATIEKYVEHRTENGLPIEVEIPW